MGALQLFQFQPLGCSCLTNPIKSPLLSPARPRFRRVQVAQEDVLETFLRERQLSGDLVSRLTDMLWEREALNFLPSLPQPHHLPAIDDDGDDDDDDDGGFLKLSTTQDWLLGDTSAPRNKKPVLKPTQDDSERRKRLSLLKYEAIKRELLVLSIGIGAACSAYCLIVFSVQAAVSYATGVVFSCAYLQLLYKHADEVGREEVPRVFRQKKKAKKIGIRSQDVEELVEKVIKGSAMALSSPRLAIPAAIYGMWIVSDRYMVLDFQIVPAMLGMFVYKAAALVQVYRDNEDLNFVFPENE